METLPMRSSMEVHKKPYGKICIEQLADESNARKRIAQPADESTSHSMKCFKRPMEEARGDSMKDYFQFSIFRVVSGAEPTKVV